MIDRKWSLVPDDYTLGASMLDAAYDDNKWLTVKNMIPLRVGYSAAKSMTATAFTALGTSPINADIVTKQDGTQRFFALTAAQIFEYTSGGGAATDRTRALGNYSGSTTYWGHAQYGDITIYTNYFDAPQSSTTGIFAAIAGTPPKAKFACVQSLAVVLAGYDDGVNQYGDGWWASDIGASTTWTPGAGNQAANGRLLSTPGDITAAHAVGNDVLLFKRGAIHVLSYVGRPIIWQTRVLDANVGAYHERMTCNVGSGVVFYSGSDFYFASPSGVRRLTVGIAALDPNAQITALFGNNNEGCVFDDVTETVYFVNRVKCYVYHLATDKWGSFKLSLNGSGITAGNVGAVVRSRVSATMSFTVSLGGTAASPIIPVVFYLKQAYVHNVSGSSYGSWVQSAFLGRADMKTKWTRITPVLGRVNSTSYVGSGAQCSILLADALNLTDENSRTVNVAGDGTFDFTDGTHTARRASFRLTTPTAVPVLDYIPEATAAGDH